MRKDKRLARRRAVNQFACIHMPALPLRPCLILDVSDTGGRLGVKDAVSLPDHFTLLLSRNGNARRTCGVVWRSKDEVGVAFDRPVFDPEQAAMVPTATIRPDPAKTPEKIGETGETVSLDDRL